MRSGRSRLHEYHVGAIAWQCRDALRDRVIGNRPFVQFDTQAGLLRHLDRSVRDLQRLGKQVLYQWVAGPVQPNSNLPGVAATKCMSQRFSEGGVRVVQCDSNGWDHHSDLKNGLTKMCARVDKPIAALIRDLKSRGLLDETLVV